MVLVLVLFCVFFFILIFFPLSFEIPFSCFPFACESHEHPFLVFVAANWDSGLPSSDDDVILAAQCSIDIQPPFLSSLLINFTSVSATAFITLQTSQLSLASSNLVLAGAITATLLNVSGTVTITTIGDITVNGPTSILAPSNSVLFPSSPTLTLNLNGGNLALGYVTNQVPVLAINTTGALVTTQGYCVSSTATTCILNITNDLTTEWRSPAVSVAMYRSVSVLLMGKGELNFSSNINVSSIAFIRASKPIRIWQATVSADSCYASGATFVVKTGSG
jgi:hypothetical protein